MSDPTPTTTTYLTRPTPAQLDRLNHISTLLHLFHHRNKNQHRRSTWYRPFSIFRRHLCSLLKSYTAVLSTPTTATAKHKKRLADRETTASIAAELDFWTGVLVPRCVRAFRQLVADGRWCVLGVFLMACLAEVCAVTGVTGCLEERARVEFEEVLERVAREVWVEDGDGGRGKCGEDVGVAVRRVEEDDDVTVADAGLEGTSGVGSRMLSEEVAESCGGGKEVVVDEGSPDEELHGADKPEKRRLSDDQTGSSLKIEQPVKVRRKGKKKRDAIDDLFSGW